MDLAPDDGKNARTLAADLMYSDQLDAALQLFGHIAAEEPRDPMPPLNISRIYTAKNDIPKAREALAKAKALDPQNLDIRYQEVKILEKEGKSDQALTALKTVLDETARRTYSETDAHHRANLLDEYGILLRSKE